MAQFFLYLFRSVAGTTQSQDRVLFAYTKSYNRDAWTLNNKPETNTNIFLMLGDCVEQLCAGRPFRRSPQTRRGSLICSVDQIFTSLFQLASLRITIESVSSGFELRATGKQQAKRTVATAWVLSNCREYCGGLDLDLSAMIFGICFSEIGQMMPNELLVTLVNSNMHHESSW